MGENLFITAVVFKQNTEEFYWDRVLMAWVQTQEPISNG